VQTLAVLESPNVHVQPVSTEHELLQPSEETEFPSSQYPEIGATTLPSPQVSLHTLAVEELPEVHVQ